MARTPSPWWRQGQAPPTQAPQPPPARFRPPGGGGVALVLLFVVALLAGAGTLWWLERSAGPGTYDSGATMPAWEVCFTPGGNCADLIVREIGRAQRQVLVQAYSFTSPTIAQALIAAKRRGVDVQVILDRSQLSERYGSGDFLSHAGIPVLVDDPPGIAHNKVMVIDGEVVITGSFNFTRSAQERNAENLLVLRDQTLAADYMANWERRRAASVPYDRALESRPSNTAPNSPKRALSNLF